MSNQHVTPRDNGWAVIGEGNSRATAILSTQAEAIARGREIAINQESELFIHGKDNLFRARNSYGNDPESSK